MSKAEEIVREYLAAMERRYLAAAKALLGPGFHMVLPGARRFDTLEALVEWASARYRSARKTYELDGSHYSGIRFIDRFTVRDGKLADQNVWNDMAELLRR